jgi:hypothetical protein
LRVEFAVNEVILTTAWYMTQILPPPPDCVRQINAALSYFIWKGAIFKVPLSTLQQPKDAGGRALIHIMAKCMTLFILRMERQGQQADTFTADWLKKWHLHGRTPNPPDIKGYRLILTISTGTTLKRHTSRPEKPLKTKRPIGNACTKASSQVSTQLMEYLKCESTNSGQTRTGYKYGKTLAKPQYLKICDVCGTKSYTT